MISSYRRAAAAARAELLAGGGAWQVAWRCRPGFRLCAPDGFHPSMIGTSTAALTVYGRLFHAPLAAAAAPSRISPRAARLARWSAAVSFGRRLPARRRCGRT